MKPSIAISRFTAKNSMQLSVIIPTRNRAGRLADLLETLAGQESVPFDWEVIVVDNASNDTTGQVSHKMSITLPIRIRYFLEEKLGLHHGRHRGAKEADGEILAYLDDDMILDNDWIRGTELLLDNKADAVVGPILPKWEADPPEWLEVLWSRSKDIRICGYLGLLDLGRVAKQVDPYYIFGGNCFIRKETLYGLGGFHPDGMPLHLLRYRGDGETGLMMKFKEKKLRGFYDPRARAYHLIDSNRMTIEYLCQRAYNQGISESFTQIRANQGIDNISLGKWIISLHERLARKSFTEIGRALGRRAKKILSLTKKEPYPEIRSKLEQAHKAGWVFHQNEVKKDPMLLEYVLRPTYFD